MKNKLKTLTLIILSAGVTLISGCTEEKPIIDNPPVEGTIYHSGFISENQTWTASSIHVLQNRVIVQPGVTLKIEPGTIIKGEAGQEAAKLKGPAADCFNFCKWIVTLGWSVYPLGYLFGYMVGGTDEATLNNIYNLADFINKILFGLVIYQTAKSLTPAGSK